MNDYISNLSDLNLIILMVGAFFAATQVALLIAMAIRGIGISLWSGYIALAIGAYLVVATR